MRNETRETIDAWWADLFGVPTRALWHEVTVRHPHGGHLAGYPGWLVAWAGDGVHVSAPTAAEAGEVASLREESTVSVRDVGFWHAFADQRGLVVIGPGVHHYLDVDPGETSDVVRRDPQDVRPLWQLTGSPDWDEAGFEEAIGQSGTVAFTTPGDPVHGAAMLSEHAGAARDVGLLVDPDRRQHGLGGRLGRAAASYAVRQHGFARWRCDVANLASVRTAARLGFEPYATQLAVTRGSSGA